VRLVNEDFAAGHLVAYLSPFYIFPVGDLAPLSRQRSVVGRESIVSEFQTFLSKLFDLLLARRLLDLNNLLLDVLHDVELVLVKHVKLVVVLLMLNPGVPLQVVSEYLPYSILGKSCGSAAPASVVIV